MVQMDVGGLPSSSNEEFFADGLESVHLKFVGNADEIDAAPEYAPEYVYQHFGDDEKIFGYKNLSVTLVYSEASMKILPLIKYDKKINEQKEGVKADDIMVLLKAQLPEEQMNMQVESLDQFRAILAKEDAFKPYGELVSKFAIGENRFELYKVDESSPEFDKYLTRVQTLALFYINAAEYTDNSDPKWMHYFLYRATPRTDGEKGAHYALAGYASLYRFYAYPQNTRPRIAHMLVLPQFRGSGTGASLLQRIYGDLRTYKEIIDVTIEDPADACIFVRDYVDCINCAKLPEFAPDKLKLGFSSDMAKAANDKLKMNKRQVRRVYEILRLRATDKKDPAAMKAYRIDVKRRLDLPMRRNDKDWKKIRAALDPEEVKQVAATQLSPEDRMQQLQQLYEKETEAYFKTIGRMDTYPKIA